MASIIVVILTSCATHQSGFVPNSSSALLTSASQPGGAAHQRKPAFLGDASTPSGEFCGTSDSAFSLCCDAFLDPDLCLSCTLVTCDAVPIGGTAIGVTPTWAAANCYDNPPPSQVSDPRVYYAVPGGSYVAFSFPIPTGASTYYWNHKFFDQDNHLLQANSLPTNYSASSPPGTQISETVNYNNPTIQEYYKATQLSGNVYDGSDPINGPGNLVINGYFSCP
jgi:hypothetical protein